MSDALSAFVGADIFDGSTILSGHALLVQAGKVIGVVPRSNLSEAAEIVELAGGTLAPGFVDLQVNGGGGVMLNDAQDVATLRCIADAHASLGSAAILPTLITDTPERTRAAIGAAVEAIDGGVPGIAGLHLEGPHLSVARKGAHDPSLIRPMTSDDIAVLAEAADRLPALMVTIAPENVTNDQIAALAEAGAVVSLGHTDTDHATCVAAAAAGARCVTHLFNAMRQLGNREPGVVGAALDEGRLSAGMIADNIHVHPATMAAALRAKAGPGRIFLVSDAMAPAGSTITEFVLNGRRITRRNGRLTLADGTLAGADLDLATAVRNLVQGLHLDLAEALEMATSLPARIAGLEGECGRLERGRRADFLHLDANLHLAGFWRAGIAVNDVLR